MKRVVRIFLFTIGTIIVLAGCSEPKIKFNDNGNDFKKYITYSNYYYDASYYNEETDINWVGSEIEYALDADNVLYSYAVEVNDENEYTLNAEKVLPDGETVDQIFSMEGTIFITTQDKNVYKELIDSEFELFLNSADVALYSEHENSAGSDSIQISENASALTKDGSLFVWGNNFFGQLGNGLEGSSQLNSPSLILENVRSYVMNLSPEESYYRGVAINTNNELYVWGELPKTSEEYEYTASGGFDMEFEMSDTRYIKHPNQTTNEARKKSDNIQSFELTPNEIIATTIDGEEIKINDEIEDTVNEVVEEGNFKNSEYSNNLWNPIFNEVLVSLDAKYYNGFVEEVYGTIRNNTNSAWSSVRILVGLYDKEDNYIKEVSYAISADINPGAYFDFYTDKDEFYYYHGKKYEVLSVSPW